MSDNAAMALIPEDGVEGNDEARRKANIEALTNNRS